MRTVGQILRETREAKIYTIEDVAAATKIRKEMLKALESDDYSKLPPPTFVQGFIKNYAHFLNLDAQKLLAVYRREFAQGRHQPYVMDVFSKPLGSRKLQVTPARILGLLVSLIILSFFAYLWTQYRQFNGAPSLELNSPADQLTTEAASVVVEGKTDPEVQVFVNSQEIAVDENGFFKEDVALSSQINKVTIVSMSKFGQNTTIERTVYQKK